MPIVTEQMPNLMNGVSQQAVTMRMSSQCEEQINGFSSIVEGTNKRPPTKHVAKIIDGIAGDAYVYTIDRGRNEQYVVIIADGTLRVFDMDGVEKTVNAPNGMGYLTAVDTAKAFKAITINDFTFFVNKETTVQEAADTAPDRPNKVLLFVKGVNYGVKYEAKRNGALVASYDVPSSTNAPKIGTALVAEGIRAGLAANLGAAYSVARQDYVIEVTRVDGGAMDRFEFEDDFGSTYTEVIDVETKEVSSLPTIAPQGFVTKIVGDISSTEDDYYLTFETKDGSATIAEGQWVETVAPGVKIAFDAATMPHTLVRETDGTFTFDKVEWGPRIAGDLNSSPWPSFVGRAIRDIYLDRNRLCFLSGPNVIMSRSRALFEFFPTTVTTLLDDGPLDVSASGASVSELHAAIPFNREVILFADQTQFTIDDEELLASRPPAIRVLTDYETDPDTVPVAVGRTLFFTVTRGLYTSAMEYYVLDDTDTTDAADVSKHVPTYIPKGTFKLAASPTTDLVLALSSDTPNKVYPYKYYWRGTEKVQSSWSTWQIADDATIMNVDFIKDECVLIVQYPDGVYLEKMDVSEGQIDDGVDFTYRLDRRVTESEVTTVYDSATQRTTITLPYVPSSPAKMLVATRPGGITSLTVASTPDIISVTGDQMVVDGDLTMANFYIGETYEFRYTFSEPMIKTRAQEGGMASITAGRLQIHKWYVSFNNTGYFRVEVEAENRPKYTYTYSGKILGTSSATIGVPVINSGTFGFRVNSRSNRVKITIINDSFLPSYFTAAEWEGRYERRTAR